MWVARGRIRGGGGVWDVSCLPVHIRCSGPAPHHRRWSCPEPEGEAWGSVGYRGSASSRCRAHGTPKIVYHYIVMVFALTVAVPVDRRFRLLGYKYAVGTPSTAVGRIAVGHQQRSAVGNSRKWQTLPRIPQQVPLRRAQRSGGRRGNTCAVHCVRNSCRHTSRSRGSAKHSHHPWASISSGMGTSTCISRSLMNCVPYLSAARRYSGTEVCGPPGVDAT